MALSFQIDDFVRLRIDEALDVLRVLLERLLFLDRVVIAIICPADAGDDVTEHALGNVRRRIAAHDAARSAAQIVRRERRADERSKDSSSNGPPRSAGSPGRRNGLRFTLP